MTNNKKTFIEVPFSLGDVVELYDNPNVIAKVCQYRFFIENNNQVLTATLNVNTNENEENINYEITIGDLVKNWKKSEKLFPEPLDKENFIRLPEFEKNENGKKIL